MGDTQMVTEYRMAEMTLTLWHMAPVHLAMDYDDLAAIVGRPVDWVAYVVGCDHPDGDEMLALAEGVA